MQHEPRAPALTEPNRVAHSVPEDIYAIIISMVFVAVGLVLLRSAGLVTCGVAGVALLASYAFPCSAGTLFTLVNLPLLLLAYFTMGTRFTIKSVVASLGVTFALEAMPQAFLVAFVDPMFAAFVGGTLCGMGALALARHGTGTGTGIVTLWLQRKCGINAGITQAGIDAAILLAALSTLPAGRVGWSALAAAAMSAMVMAWHRPGRYAGR